MKDLEGYQIPLLDLCRRAGDEIADLYQSSAALDVDYKSDSSPITLADRRSHQILLAGLQQMVGDYPVLSEESTMPDWHQRALWKTYWLVDPLDGTKEFVGRTGEFTINIALVSGNRPVLGMIYLPLERCAYFGASGVRGRRISDKQAIDLEPRVANTETELIAQTSRRHRGEQLDACLAGLNKKFGGLSRQYVGSALKFCHLAEGRADIYPRFSPCSEWDTAAGQALLEAVGGCVVDMQFRPLQYNSKASTLNPYFYAMADGEFPWQAVLTAPY